MRINNQPDNRLLEQRSRLEFHYPQQDMILFLPFFENPVISESKAANLVEYDLLGRSSSMFAYTGAKARRFKVEVSYTLPHLINFNMGVERFRRLTTAESKEEQINLFMKSWNDTNYNNEYGSWKNKMVFNISRLQLLCIILRRTNVIQHQQLQQTEQR